MTHAWWAVRDSQMEGQSCGTNRKREREQGAAKWARDDSGAPMHGSGGNEWLTAGLAQE
jgi:hypothetical protein